jgi:hypothetical protein
MQLVLSNAQSELSPLEIGVHALEAVGLGVNQWSGRGLSGDAEQIGKSKGSVAKLIITICYIQSVVYLLFLHFNM